jgi:hypothetical protein
MHEIIVEFLNHIDVRLMRKLGSSSCDLILNALCLVVNEIIYEYRNSRAMYEDY